MDIMNKYNKILTVNNKFNYPFNLISNLKQNIIETKKEVELEYVKDFILLPLDKKGGSINKDIVIYFY